MVIRFHHALTTRFLAYSVVVMAIALPLSFALADGLLLQGRRDAFMDRHLEAQAQFVAKEIQRDWQGQGPTQARLNELAEALHLHLRFVPWQAQARPDALAQSSLWREEGPRASAWRMGGPPQPPGASLTLWAKVLHHGQAVGAVALRFPFGPLDDEGLAPGVGAAPGLAGEMIAKPTHRPRPPHVPVRELAVLAWAAMVALLLAPPLWWWVLKPLRGMVATAERLGAGHLEQAVPTTRPDELGALEQAFESLRLRVLAMLQNRERLLVDLSHELRGPLQRMGLALPLLERAGAPLALTQLLENELKGSEALVADVLAWARAGHGPGQRQEALQLLELGQEQLDLRQLRAKEAGIELVGRLQALHCWGDGAWLGRALGNLLDNAIRHARRRVLLTIKPLAGGGVELLVDDDGPGLPESERPAAFEPFHRPDDSRSRDTGGTGLGLAIVRAIARAHGGEARLGASEWGGLQACILLPPPTTAKSSPKA